MIYFLICDTVHGFSRVILSNKDSVIVEYNDDIAFRQAEKLPLIIKSVLQEANIGYHDISYFVVNVGPGSFMGIRIAMSLISSINLIYQKPYIILDSLQLLAYAKVCEDSTFINNKDIILSIINARRNCYYIQEFNNKALPISKAKIVSTSELQDMIMLSDNQYHLICKTQDMDHIKNCQKYTDCEYSGQDMVNLSFDKYLNSNFVTQLNPLYIAHYL